MDMKDSELLLLLLEGSSFSRIFRFFLEPEDFLSSCLWVGLASPPRCRGELTTSPRKNVYSFISRLGCTSTPLTSRMKLSCPPSVDLFGESTLADREGPLKCGRQTTIFVVLSLAWWVQNPINVSTSRQRISVIFNRRYIRLSKTKPVYLAEKRIRVSLRK